jgi:hypothetical protein
LGRYPKEFKDIHINSQLHNEWINKMEDYSALKRKEIQTHATM